MIIQSQTWSFLGALIPQRKQHMPRPGPAMCLPCLRNRKQAVQLEYMVMDPVAESKILGTGNGKII